MRRSILGQAMALVGLLSAACASDGSDLTAEDLASEDATIEVEGKLQGLVYSSTSFSMKNAYNGNYLGICSSVVRREIAGHEPSTAGKYPVYVFLTGTTMTFNGAEAQRFTAEMAERGFVAATVEYDNSTYPTTCSTMTERAKCIWDGSSSKSAISAICSRAKADCSKGIVVSGFSQGANLAALSKNYDSRVRAAFLIGHGNKAAGVIDVSKCANNSATTLLPSQMRSVNGESDSYFGGNAANVRSQLSAVVGVSCSTNNCLQADGSGWFVISNASVADREADPCYYFNSANTTCSSYSGFDASWDTGTSAYAKDVNLDWLATRATR